MVKDEEFRSSRIWEDGRFLYTKDGQVRSSERERDNSEEGKKQSNDTRGGGREKNRSHSQTADCCVQRDYQQPLCVYLRARRRRREGGASGWRECLLARLVLFDEVGSLLYGQLDLEWEEGRAGMMEEEQASKQASKQAAGSGELAYQVLHSALRPLRLPSPPPPPSASSFLFSSPTAADWH